MLRRRVVHHLQKRLCGDGGQALKPLPSATLAPLPTKVTKRPTAFVTDQGSQYYQWPQEYNRQDETRKIREKAERMAQWAPIPTPNEEHFKGLNLYEVCANYIVKNGPTKVNTMWKYIKSKGMVSTRKELRCWIDEGYQRKLDKMLDKLKVDPMPWETQTRWHDMMMVSRRWRYRWKGVKKKRLKRNLSNEGSMDIPDLEIPRRLPLVCMPNPTPMDIDDHDLVFDLNPYRRRDLVQDLREKMEMRDSTLDEEYNVAEDPNMWWYQVKDPEWHYQHKFLGPVTTEELVKIFHEGKEKPYDKRDIVFSTRVWNFVHMEFWTRLRDVEQLKHHISKKKIDEGNEEHRVLEENPN